MNTPPYVIEALNRAHAEGFGGQLYTHTKVFDDDRHAISLVFCEFPDGTFDPYVIVADLHENGGSPRLHSISHAVHVLQNVNDAEQWAIAARVPV